MEIKMHERVLKEEHEEQRETRREYLKRSHTRG